MSALPELDLDVGRLVLDVASKKLRDLDSRIDGAIVDGELLRTITGASTLTLTLHDPKRALLQSGIFNPTGTPTDLQLDRLWWRLVKVSKQATDLTLTFEEREVALLRRFRKPRKATRGQVTRAEFALSLVREASTSIPFISPRLHAAQPIEKAKQQPAPAKKREQKAKGIPVDAPLTVKGASASASQKRIAERVLGVADSAGADDKATLALVEACIVESLLANLAGGDRDSRGVLQVRDSTARGMHMDNRDVEACAFAFLQKGFTGRGGAMQIARQNPGLSAGQVAQLVQGSAVPTAYGKVKDEAQHWIDVFKGKTETRTIDVTKTRVLPFQYRRGGVNGERENSWECMQRLADEVNWRCFADRGAIYFVSDDVLMSAKPRSRITETTPGVETIDFDVDTGKRVDNAQLTAQAGRWWAAPGAVVLLDECGPADGRWLVSEIRRGLFDPTATIALERPGNPLAEPAAETKTTVTTKTLTTKASETLGSIASATGSSELDRLLHACRSIHNKHWPYVWGGGHKFCGVPDAGTRVVGPTGYDCSGSTCAALGFAGLGFRPNGPVMTSGEIAARWGVAGRGMKLTVWANPVHVFMVVEGRHFGTGDWGKGWGGAGFNPTMHPTAGFTPRHWPGL